MNQPTPPEQFRRFDRKVGLQRHALGFERLWSALHWPLMVLGLGVVVLLSGALSLLSSWPRLFVVVVWALLFVLSLPALFKLRWPARLTVLRHMEQKATQSHRGFSSVNDSLAHEYVDPHADVLWEEHQRRQRDSLSTAKVNMPKSHWRDFDPKAFRVGVVLAVFATLILAPHSLTSSLKEAWHWGLPVAEKPLTMDAWLKPPVYTGRPPLLLTSPSLAEKFASGVSLDTPENGVFTLRLSGASKPEVVFLGLTPDGAVGPAVTEVVPKISGKDGVFSAEAVISRPLVIVVKDGSHELARFPISTIPDQPPTLVLQVKPSGDSKGSLAVKWLGKDDYGLAKVSGDVELADEQEGGVGFESNGVFLFDAPILKFALTRSNGKEQSATSRFDMASHPWAGLQVTLTMTASDGAGQQGSITPVTFKMPERVFVKPLPRALIEQRKQLILFPERAGHVGKLVDMMALYPLGLFEGSAPVIMLGIIGSRLRNAGGYDDVNFASQQMWDLAVLLEEGALSDARAELQALKDELEKALREGAPPERIAELMDKLRGAMDRLLDAMRAETDKRIREGTLSPDQQQQQGKAISREELEKMLDALEEMSKGGANDMAQQLLDELNQMLQNLQPGQSQQSGGEAGDQMDEMMQGLGDLMRKQQRLMDDTQRLPGEGRDPGQGNGEGQSNGKDGQNPGTEGLAGRQQQLRRMLEQLQGRGEGRLPGDLGEAQDNMRGAEKSLRDQDKEEALRDQGEALDKLRKGAQELAKQMRQQGQGQAGGQAKDGEGKGGDDDPLGRPRATRNPDQGPDKNMVPTEQSMRRAREILETLRAKANERGLTDAEKSYIDRLLRGLY